MAGKRGTGHRLTWPAILARAAELVAAEQENVGVLPTLRRLHYLLLSDPLATSLGYRNSVDDYSQLSRRTAEGRRDGTFPDLEERGRAVTVPPGFLSAAEALRWLAQGYRRLRHVHLDRHVVLAVEKDGLVPVLQSRFDWLPVVALRGFSSQTLVDRIRTMLDGDGRPAALLYIGDYDASGIDIERDGSARLGYPLERVALTWSQVEDYALPPAPAKATDPRTARFAAEYGRAVQVEVDALAPAVLLDLVEARLGEIVDVSIMRELDGAEDDDRRRLEALAAELGGRP